MFVGMAQEVEGWAKDGYGGMTVHPSADEVQYEMNQLKQRFCVYSRSVSMNPIISPIQFSQSHHFD